MYLWSEERKDEVRRLLNLNWSSRQIGDQLGVSRRAIIGLVRRNKDMKLANKPGAYLQIKPKPKAKPREERPIVQLFATRAKDADARHTVGVPMLDLRANQCRWPVNDAERGQLHLFCAAATTNKLYCAHHWRLRNGGGTYSERNAERGVAA